MKPHYSPMQQHGFTLLEMLVTLVITSLVAGLLWQAMGQLVRVERFLDETAVAGASQTLREQWVRDALASATPSAADQGPPMQGNERTLEFATSQPLLPGPQGLERIRFELRLLPDQDETQIRVSWPGRGSIAAAGQPGEQSLLRWRGKGGSFKYLDRRGQWHAHWPPAIGTEELLPLAIWLDSGDPIGLSIVAFNATSPSPLPDRKQVESL